jgi:hypothetical protein
MGSAWVTLPPAPNLIRAYHFTPAEFAISNISLGRLKVARFSDANDPFELLALNYRERGARAAAMNFKASYDSAHGMLCFSSNWTSPVLWSHYGDKHRGVCLGFDLPRATTQLVQYQDQRALSELEKTGSDPSQISPALQELLVRTKYSHWSYEQELRRFIPLEDVISEGPRHFCPFGSDLQLAEVILGPKCDLSLNAVRKLVRSRWPEAVTIKARFANFSFNIVPDESTIP